MSNKNTIFLYTLLFAGTMLASVFLMKKDIAQKIKNLSSTSDRVILSTVSTKFSLNGPMYKIIKVRSDENLSLEIYKKNKKAWDFFGSIAFTDKYDGYFTFKGEAHNLFLQDIDGDDIKEIIAPSYDHNLTARINIVKYRAASEDFQKLTR